MEPEEFKIEPPDFSEFVELYRSTMVSALEVMSTIVDDDKEREKTVIEIQTDLDNTLKQLGEM